MGGRAEEKGRYLYVMDQAVSTFATSHSVDTSGVPPVPPCIIPVGDDGCQITLEIEDKGTRASLLKISADAVRVSVISSISHEQASNEVLKLFGKILGCRSTQLSVTKGPSTRHKVLSVQNLSTQEVIPWPGGASCPIACGLDRLGLHQTQIC